MSVRRGFTLTEIIVTIAIVAVIAVVALPNFTKARQRASARQAADYLRTIATAEKLYYAKWKSFIGLPNAATIQGLTGAEVSSRDFNFAVAATPTSFTATATRIGGSGGTITLNQNDAWGATGSESRYLPQG